MFDLIAIMLAKGIVAIFFLHFCRKSKTQYIAIKILNKLITLPRNYCVL